MNAERILIAAECIGDGYWFVDRARTYAAERIVFDRPIGQNQGIQFPIARAYANVRAADLMRYEAARLFDAGEPCGAEANMAKLLAADASWEAANVCLQTHGGFGFAAEYDVERKFRETRLYQVAPISTNLILSYLAEHMLGHAEVVLSTPESDTADLPLAGLRVVALEQAVAAHSRRGSSPTWARTSSRSSVLTAATPRAAYDGAVNGDVGVLRVAQSRQAERGPRSQAAARVARSARLLARADVFVHNLRRAPSSGSASAYDDLRARNPRLVWCGISGYGPDGPLRDKKAYDMLVQAESGVVSVTGSADAPAKVGVSIADIASGCTPTRPSSPRYSGANERGSGTASTSRCWSVSRSG